MAFIPHVYDGGSVSAWEYFPASAITPKIGLCLALNATTGLLEISEKPQFICMQEAAAAVTLGTMIPVIKIDYDIEFETRLDGASSFVAGDKVDVDSTGLLVDADSSTDAGFLLTYMAGQAEGDMVRGRFVGR